MNESTSLCPTCGKERKPNPRYPQCICKECTKNVKDEYGNELIITNSNTPDGIIIAYPQSGEERTSSICYVNGFKCLASEAHTGGIVIQVIDEI